MQADEPVKYQNSVEGIDWAKVGPNAEPTKVLVTFAQGQTQANFSVLTKGDNLIEPDEIITAKIIHDAVSNPTVTIDLIRGSAKAVIENDDGDRQNNVGITGLVGVVDLDSELAAFLREDIYAAVARIEKTLGSSLPHLEIHVSAAPLTP